MYQPTNAPNRAVKDRITIGNFLPSKFKFLCPVHSRTLILDESRAVDFHAVERYVSEEQDRDLPMLHEVNTAYEFGSYRLDAAKRLLIRSGRHIAVAPKTFDLLLLLVEGRGRVLTRAELMSALWPDTFVEEANLSFQISALRKTLGEDGIEWIETVPKHGYRFSGTVETVGIDLPHGNGSTERAPSSDHVAPATNRHPEFLQVTGITNGHVLAQLQQPAHPWPAGIRRWLGLSLVMLAATAGVLLIIAAPFRNARPSEPTVRFQIPTSDKVMFKDHAFPAVSPDGKQVAFVALSPGGGRRLWVRPLDSVQADPLPGTELAETAFWSYDSRSLAFFASGKLKVIDLRGGTAQTLCDAPGGSGAGTWGSKDVILFQTSSHRALSRVAASGGEVKPVTSLDTSRQETAHYAPQFLPDGRHFIFYLQSARPENTGIYVGSLDSTESRRLVGSNTNAAYAQSSDGSGYLLFTNGSKLMGQSFNPSSLKLTDDPFPMAEQVLVTLAGGIRRAAFSASENGVLIYRSGTSTGSAELVWVDRHGNRLSRLGTPGDYSNPALSPDEKKVAVSRMDPQRGSRDLWLFDLARSTSSRITFDPGDETNPAWSPDGSRIAFTSHRQGDGEIYAKALGSTAEPERLFESPENKSVQSWSPDGKFILSSANGSVWKLPLDGDRKSKTPLGQGHGERSSVPEISPDGRWVAYQLDGPNNSEVYVEKLSAPEANGRSPLAEARSPTGAATGRNSTLSQRTSSWPSRSEITLRRLRHRSQRRCLT